jgi:hypothetical protein
MPRKPLETYHEEIRRSQERELIEQKIELQRLMIERERRRLQ